MKNWKEPQQFTISEVDFLKARLTSVLSQLEKNVKELKTEAQIAKAVKLDKVYIDEMWQLVKKNKQEIAKLSEIQRKLKRV